MPREQHHPPAHLGSLGPMVLAKGCAVGTALSFLELLITAQSHHPPQATPAGLAQALLGEVCPLGKQHVTQINQKARSHGNSFLLSDLKDR